MSTGVGLRAGAPASTSLRLRTDAHYFAGSGSHALLRHHRRARRVDLTRVIRMLARGLKRMVPAYRLKSIRSFDLFPQTAHVESVALVAFQ
jgi:hypothetical protein